MGGGDLNLKKSWHPNTMKNQERVWKVEQANAAEKNKLAELQREISDERDREELKRVGQMSGVLSAPDSNKKLEWMYRSSGDLLNREEYLLGRSIDKNFERSEAEEKETLVGVQVHKNHVEHECIPFSIRSYHGIQISDEQVDLQRKIMEDPLMAIRQREMETRKKLLENPVKLKEIHRLLRHDNDLDHAKRGKAKKSSKKMKKDKILKKSSKNDANDDNLDEILAKKYHKIRKDTLDEQDDGNLDINKFLALKYNQLSNELDKISGKTGNSKLSKNKDYCEQRGRASKSKRLSENRFNSPDRNIRSRKYSPSNRNRISRSRSRSTSAQRKSGNSDDRQKKSSAGHSHYESYRSRNQRSPNKERDRRDRRSPSKERDRRDRRSPSKERDRRDRRSPSKERERRYRRSRSIEKKNLQSLSKERDERNRSKKIDISFRLPVKSTKRSRSSSSSRSSDSMTRREHPRQNYGLVTADGKKIEIKDKYQRVHRNENDKSVPKMKANLVKPKRIQLTEEEKERKLMEMQADAKLRVIECRQTMEKNKKEKLAEETQINQQFDKDYINKEMRKALTNQFSVESRIKSNINNIQRSTKTMEANFAKR